ncbi:MAG: O-antigen ligase family protein [Verrucomicrobiota bacterium]
MVEYYFQDQLRWSFGFENPNKAAALIASLLPLLWVIAQSGWRIKRATVKWPLAVLGAGAICAGWWLLFMTFSRGGIVAAAVGFLYIGWRERHVLFARDNRTRQTVMIATVLGIAVLFAATNAAERSTQWVANREGSVENRFELWCGGLQMIAQIPQGVGQGKSGSAYMQWFQPLDSTTRYRTLVNSYLTFAVEQGIGIFALAVFGAAMFWHWSDVSRDAKWIDALMTGSRGSLAAFAVAGFFSTTMEEWVLWAVPVACAFALLVGTIRSRDRRFIGAVVLAAAVISLVSCVGLYASGWIVTAKQPVRISYFGEKVNIESVGGAHGRDFIFCVDETVLGEDYGKLLRRLAIDRNATVHVNGTIQNQNQVFVATGETVSRLSSENPDISLVLIAPTRIEPDVAKEILRKAKSVMLFTSSFDDDGRVAFWKEAAAETGVKPLEIEGVGSQVESAWDELMKKL